MFKNQKKDYNIINGTKREQQKEDESDKKEQLVAISYLCKQTPSFNLLIGERWVFLFSEEDV
jgi:hypothetical protein